VVFGIGKQNLLIDSGRVVAVGVNHDAARRVVNVSGRYLVPGFIDSHVHLAYYAEGATELSSNGIVAVLDLAAPLSALSVAHAPLRVLNAGPMLTATGGYPTNAWGADGYGLGVANPAAGAAAVETLIQAGVQAIKVPLTAAPTLDDATVKAVVQAAHARKLKVYTHALEEPNVARAAKFGIDVLAHTPTEALSEATLEAWKTRTVISTLSAFGGGSAALNNLRALRERGARVLYGTDFGNTRETNIQSLEITQLLAAGMDGASIVKAGTSVPAEFLGLTDLGSLEVGKRASFLVLAADPTVDPHTLSQPVAVYVDGTLVSAGL
jgi:imidazolonepropionase-like amidohydrolase